MSESSGRKDGAGSSLVHKLVKSELEYLFLALLMRRPMCGTDIIKEIHVKFGLLLSPGTVYPLLHDLETRGLIQHEPGTKIKIYSTVKGMRQKIKDMLEQRISDLKQVIEFLLQGE
ncbi:MAG: PadR family transcriptional regulator [Candidatus Hadarchaeum sp.]|uniref:PadR family transcriptional regulator n=1 Tax=Candidatus Hadarchaeum sp. TaxID=2883567 RepID=UPI003173E5A9